MKILNIPQRSEEWLTLHEGAISGSKAKDYSKPRYISKAELLEFAESKGYRFSSRLTIENIRNSMTKEELDELDYTVQLNDSIYKLIAERIAKPINPNDYEERLNGRQFSMMARGEILEQEALEVASQKIGKIIFSGRVWQSDVNKYMICSPDGEIAEPIDESTDIMEAVEVKCLDTWKMVKAFYEKSYPIDYKDQVVQYFLVNENLQKLYFVMYSDVIVPEQVALQVFEIKREDLQAEIEMAGKLQTATLTIVEKEVQKLMF
jgi:yqaJ-like viral recombinase domain